MRRAVVCGLIGLVLTLGAGTAPAQEAEWRAFADAGWRAARQGDQPAAKDLLEKARQVAEGFPADDARRTLTTTYLAYAASQRGDRAEADRLARDAAPRLDKLPIDSPNRGRGFLALALTSIAGGRPDAADSQLRKAIESEEKQRGAQHLVVVQLVASRAEFLESQGRFEEAEPLRKRQIDALDVPNDLTRATLALAAHRQTGGMYRRWNRTEAAVPHSVRAVELCRGLRLPDEKLAEHLIDLGELHLALRQFDKAGPPLQDALKILEQAHGLRPSVEQAELARCLHTIGALYVAQGRFFPAEPVLERALTIREKAHGDDLRTAGTLNVLAAGHSGQRSYRKAEKELLRALQIRESLLGKGHLTVAATHEDLAAVYLKADHAEAAEVSLKRAVEIREQALGPNHPSVIGSLHALANLYRDRKRASDAEPLYKRAVLAREKASGADSPGLPGVLDDYAALLKQLEKPAEAEKIAARAAAIRAKSPGKSQ